MHFDKINKQLAKCKMCGKICPTAGNISNLHSHLKNIHKTSILKTDFIEECFDKYVDDPGSVS